MGGGAGTGLRAGLVQDQAAAPKAGPSMQFGAKASTPKAKSSPMKALAPKAKASPGLHSASALGLDSDDDDDDDDEFLSPTRAMGKPQIKGIAGLGLGSLRLGRTGGGGGRGTGSGGLDA